MNKVTKTLSIAMVISESVVKGFIILVALEESQARLCKAITPELSTLSPTIGMFL